MSNSETPSQRLVNTAVKLFCRDGIHATGIDRIICESGSARLSLYRSFGSKSGLVAAALESEGQAWRAWFFEELDAVAGGPLEKLLAVFDLLGEWFRCEDYFGCLYMNATIETRNADPAIRRALESHKRKLLKRIRNLADEAGADDPLALTQQIDLLIDGAIVKAFIARSPRPARQARDAARVLIEHACGRSGEHP